MKNIKDLLKEGQTQVYTNGMVTPQSGVNTNAPHLNQPPKQLLDIIRGLHTGTLKSDAQLLAILVGMGIPQQLALSGIHAYSMNTSMKSTHENKNTHNQKNHSIMKFTLASLYENVTKCIRELRQITSDKSRISYSTQNATKILETSLQTFPMRFKDNDVKVISEEVELAVNPALKFRIAKNLHKQLSIVDWVAPVKNLREFIENAYIANQFLFRVNEAVERLETQRGTLQENLTESMNSLLNESNEVAKSKFQVIATKNPWSSDCKVITNELLIAESKLIDTSTGKVIKTLSPVIVNENGMSFFLHGKVYTINEGEITEGAVNDVRFYNVLEGLRLFKRDGDSLVTFSESGKTLEYDLREGTLKLGEIDMTNVSIIELKEALLVTNFSGYRNHHQNDVLCNFFESIDLLYEMDNFTTIQSQEWVNVFLTMISIEENIFINKVNPAMQMNEMKKVSTATEAVKVVKEFINYDVTPVLSERLISENFAKAIQNKKIEGINEKIEFLEGEKSTIVTAINSFGETVELKAAKELLESEIKKSEVELSASYSNQTDAELNEAVTKIKVWDDNAGPDEDGFKTLKALKPDDKVQFVKGDIDPSELDIESKVITAASALKHLEDPHN